MSADVDDTPDPFDLPDDELRAERDGLRELLPDVAEDELPEAWAAVGWWSLLLHLRQGRPEDLAPAAEALAHACALTPPGDGQLLAARRLLYGHVRACQYELDDSRTNFLDEAHALLVAGLEGIDEGTDGLEGLDGQETGDADNDPRPFARTLLAEVATVRYRQAEGDRGLLDEAIHRLNAALPDQEPGTVEVAVLHETLGDLHFERCGLTADDLGEAETSAHHYRAAIAAAPPDSDIPMLLFVLGRSLLLLGGICGDRDVLSEARDAFLRARAEAMPQDDGQQPSWFREASIRAVVARALLWGHWKEDAELAPAEKELEPLLAEPDALETLPPEYLEAFARMLYECAVARGDGVACDRAIAVLQSAVDRWPREDGNALSAVLCLGGFQHARYLGDKDPARLPVVADCAAWLLGMEEAGVAVRRTALTLLGATRREMARLGLAEKDDALWQNALRAYQEMLDDFSNGRTFLGFGEPADESPSPPLYDISRLRQSAGNFKLAYRRWLAMEPGSQEHSLLAAGLLIHVAIADPETALITQEETEALFRASLGAAEDTSWQAAMHGLTGTQLMRFGDGRRSGALHDAVAYVNKAVDMSGTDGKLRDRAEMTRSMVTRRRAQVHGGTDEIESAIETWLRLRQSPTLGLKPRERRLMDAQVFSIKGLRAAARGDLAETDRCLAKLLQAHAEVEPADQARVEVWTCVENLRTHRNVIAQDLGVPPMPPPPGRPSIDELRRLSDRFPRNARARVLGDHGVTRCVEGTVKNDARALKEGISLIQEARELCDESSDDWLRYTYGLGINSCTLAILQEDLRLFDSGIDWLERAHRAIAGPESRMWADAGMALAFSYRRRAKVRRTTGLRGDRALSRRIGLDALRGFAWAALLQSGTGHAADAAAKATVDALEVAGWCLEDGVPEEAVQALDSCRGLVLHAASTSMSVPDRLTAASREDLAAEWRTTGGIEPLPGQNPLLKSADALPSELRRRVLEVLTGPDGTRQPQGALLDPPVPGEIGGALTALGMDALAYLVPSAGDRAGTAVVVTANGRTHALPLPLLREQAGPVREYQPGQPAGRDMGPVPGASARPPVPLRKQLDRLCAWAWYAAMKPLLQALGAPERTPRLVLIPMGALGVVPWHAAWEPGPAGTRRYAVEGAEISYAASARLLCDVAARPAVPHTGAALVVGNPTGDLRYAGEEADAVQRAFYPVGRFLGGEATPSAVLSWLRGGESAGGVLHLACHGTVAENRRHSAYLSLSGGELAAEELTEAVTATAGGNLELVVLAACRTHVSGRGHNEAYSLATAFLVAGAASVVGSLWPVPDDATSVLIYMTHHFLRREGEPPRRALRRAQLWMLDPARELPDDMPEALASRARATDPDDLSAWAGFTHLGR